MVPLPTSSKYFVVDLAAKINFWNFRRQIVSCLFPSLTVIKFRCGNAKPVVVDLYSDYIKLNFIGVATFHFISRLIFLSRLGCKREP